MLFALPYRNPLNSSVSLRIARAVYEDFYPRTFTVSSPPPICSICRHITSPFLFSFFSHFFLTLHTEYTSEGMIADRLSVLDSAHFSTSPAVSGAGGVKGGEDAMEVDQVSEEEGELSLQDSDQSPVPYLIVLFPFTYSPPSLPLVLSLPSFLSRCW